MEMIATFNEHQKEDGFSNYIGFTVEYTYKPINKSINYHYPSYELAVYYGELKILEVTYYLDETMGLDTTEEEQDSVIDTLMLNAIRIISEEGLRWLIDTSLKNNKDVYYMKLLQSADF